MSRRWSFKARLSLALSVMVGLLAVVGLSAYAIQRDIQREVAVFCARQHIDLREIDLESHCLELEGTWDPGGIFIAESVEAFPGRRRPKLRGTLQEFDPEGAWIRLYGRQIFLSESLQKEHTDTLESGQRIEVTCDVDGDRWKARKVNINGVKPSDKIKACPSRWELDGSAPETVEIHGIRVSLVAPSDRAIESALKDVNTATQLLLACNEMRNQAERLLDWAPELAQAGTDLESDTRLLSDPKADLRAARNEFIHYLTRSRQSDEGVVLAPNRFIAELSERMPTLELKLEALSSAAERDPDRAASLFTTDLSPFLAREIQPRLDSYLRDVQDDLGDRARTIESSTKKTSRSILFVGILATLVAVVLGVLLWNSVRTPLREFEAAARRIGKGDFETPVEVEVADEFGDLARAFNQMSARLTNSTVSIDQLQNVIDSMAGALWIVTPDLKVKSANAAAVRLLGWSREELEKASLQMLCAPGTNAEEFVRMPTSQDVVERNLLRADGSMITVSFSTAELGSQHGETEGYVCVAQDLSEQKRVEEEVRSSLKEKELLLREVHHRVKNNMQIISSLLAMQQECSDQPAVVRGLEQSQSRIRSMALVHEHLYQSSDLARADASTYLELLVDHIVQSCGARDRIDVQCHIEPIELDVDQTLSLGLIVNELLANAFQHAFPPDGKGQVSLGLTRIGARTARLSISDDGRGMTAMSPGKKSRQVGLSLVETLVEQLEGELNVELETGVSTSIEFACKEPEEVYI